MPVPPARRHPCASIDGAGAAGGIWTVQTVPRRLVCVQAALTVLSPTRRCAATSAPGRLAVQPGASRTGASDCQCVLLRARSNVFSTGDGDTEGARMFFLSLCRSMGAFRPTIAATAPNSSGRKYGELGINRRLGFCTTAFTEFPTAGARAQVSEGNQLRCTHAHPLHGGIG